MSDQKPPDKPPDALSDTLKGLGLLFRAARTVAKKIPTRDLEEVVATSAREVGRAIENVATTIERNVRGKKPGSGPSTPPTDPEHDGDSRDPKTPS
jgi:hypothetical protein